LVGKQGFKIMKVFEILEAHGNDSMYDKCWKGYRKVKGKKRGEKGSCVKETASVGATSAGNIASVSSVPGAKRKISKTGRYGAPEAPQKKNPDGTAKNALDVKDNIMGGKTIKR
jgi:hypothetical protein